MRAADIAFAVARRANSPFQHRRQLCMVPNVSWGLDLSYEADVVAITKAGYINECEIKCNFHDFLYDSKKIKWRSPLKMRLFYYAIDAKFLDRALKITRPKGTGLIAVYEKNGDYELKVIERAVVNKFAVKASDQQILKLATLGCMRLWDNKKITRFFGDFSSQED